MRSMFDPRRDWTDATWVRKDKRIHGSWTYNWAGDFFIVEYGRQERRIRVFGDTPEWDGWKLERKRNQEGVKP
jgi:hypothetical protein